jgi:SAM-dependent methyltransferase
MSNLRDRSTFETAYGGKAPWDIGKPQGAIAESVDLVISPVLDAGCGTGENALFLAASGHQVTGIDFVDEAIRMARRKSAERGLTVEFQVKDAMTLGDWDKRFGFCLPYAEPRCGAFIRSLPRNPLAQIVEEIFSDWTDVAAITAPSTTKPALADPKAPFDKASRAG